VQALGEEILGTHLVVIKNCVSSRLDDMVIPPIQNIVCMKVPWMFPGPGHMFGKEDTSHNVFRLTSKRKHMSNAEQS